MTVVAASGIASIIPILLVFACPLMMIFMSRAGWGQLLLRLHRRFHTLAAPAIATAAFIGIFAVSTLLISPLITGGEDGSPGQTPSSHWAHHHLK